MLYNYRVKNRKDFYTCDISIIKKAFKTCEKSLKCMNQKGGNSLDMIHENINKLIIEKNNKIKQIEKYNNLLLNE
jgi:hypothetical protein